MPHTTTPGEQSVAGCEALGTQVISGAVEHRGTIISWSATDPTAPLAERPLVAPALSRSSPGPCVSSRLNVTQQQRAIVSAMNLRFEASAKRNRIQLSILGSRDFQS